MCAALYILRGENDGSPFSLNPLILPIQTASTWLSAQNLQVRRLLPPFSSGRIPPPSPIAHLGHPGAFTQIPEASKAAMS
jgi:hypothetical protein